MTIGSDRPAWVTCIREPSPSGPARSWCGRSTGFDFVFSDVDHAAKNGREGGRLVACPACTGLIVAALTAGHDEIGTSPETPKEREFWLVELLGEREVAQLARGSWWFCGTDEDRPSPPVVPVRRVDLSG